MRFWTVVLAVVLVVTMFAASDLSLTVTISTGEDETEIAILVGTKPS